MEHYDYYHRECQMSSDLFGGFKMMIDIRSIGSEQDIIQIMKERLIQLFQVNDLPYLVNEVNKRDFHIHSHSLEEILVQDSAETVVYVCDHCSS